MIILETPRLKLRKICKEDRRELALILQDEQVMYAWEHGFSDDELERWIDENIMRYDRDGYSYNAVIEKVSGRIIGATGLIFEQSENESGNENHVGVGYIFGKSHWGRGYAFEAASACVDYGFNFLGLKEITAQIRPENLASRKLAEKIGMRVLWEFVKHYGNRDMVHLLYGMTCDEYETKEECNGEIQNQWQT